MRVLFIGDIFGKTGIRAIKTLLPKIKNDYKIDYVIANAENVTNCSGLNKMDYLELKNAGINFFTMGNHTWNNNEIYSLLNLENDIIRPYNVKSAHKFGQVGVGTKIVYFNKIKIRITNLIGKSVYFNGLQTNPFHALDEIINFDNNESDIHIVDFHTETTGEKNALFFEFRGRVSAILGTHTHIQTADNKIIENTAFITDVGSTGPMSGILGAKPKFIIDKLKNEVNKFIIEEEVGLFQFSAVVLVVDEKNKKIENIDRILIYEENKNID